MKSTLSLFSGLTRHEERVGVWRLAALMLLLTVATAAAEPRLALVIGNGAYQEAPLKNPVNDARDMAAKLRELGFQVIERFDANRQTLRQALREFEQGLRQQRGVGLFYYAGHGVQLKGQNYLIPVGVDIRQEFEVPDEALDADAVLRAMEAAGNQLNIVILDACRNNPFVRGVGGGGRGLARMDGPVGTFIAYATAPGAISQDGNGRNSPYTRGLLAAMSAPGLSLEQVFKQVLVAVEQETGGTQIPWVASSLRGDFFFKPSLASPLAPTPKEPPTSAGAVDPPTTGAKEPAGRQPEETASTPSGSGPAPAAADSPAPKTAFLEPALVENDNQGVAISRHPVSLEHYRRFADATGRVAPAPASDSVEDPVRVTWREAMDYAAWLTATSKRTYRLPTESEWERAVQGKQDSQSPAGEEREWTCSEYRRNYEGQEQRCAEQLPEAVTIRVDTGRAGADPLSEDLAFRLVRVP